MKSALEAIRKSMDERSNMSSQIPSSSLMYESCEGTTPRNVDLLCTNMSLDGGMMRTIATASASAAEVVAS